MRKSEGSLEATCALKVSERECERSIDVPPADTDSLNFLSVLTPLLLLSSFIILLKGIWSVTPKAYNYDGWVQRSTKLGLCYEGVSVNSGSLSTL